MRKQTGGPDNNFVEAFGVVLSDNSLMGASNPLPVTMANTQSNAKVTQVDYSGGQYPIYIGVAASGSETSAAAWQIRKFAYDGNNNVTSIKYAATGAADQIWDNRASLTYS